jgi:hypothetical protein
MKIEKMQQHNLFISGAVFSTGGRGRLPLPMPGMLFVQRAVENVRPMLK